MSSINTPIVNLWSSNSTGAYSSSDVNFLTFYNNFMYFSNSGARRIVQADSNGNVTNASWATSSNGLSANFACVAYNGALYITSLTGLNSIVRVPINNDGTAGTSSVFNNTIFRPMGISVGTANNVDYLYVTSYEDNGKISRINLSNGEVNLNWPQPTIGSGSYAGSSVYDGYLYVPATTTGNLYKFSLSDGTGGVWQSNTSNSSPGYLTQPTGSVIWNGYIYVSNWTGTYTYINKISLTYPNIDYTSNWVTPSTPNGGLSQPCGMAVYNSYLYVQQFRSGSGPGIYSINLPPPCFKEGSKILTAKGYIPIEDLRKGDYVRTFKNGFVPVDIIGKREIYHEACEQRIPGQLYQCSKEQFEELIEPLVITGCHSILVDEFVSEEQKEKTIEVNGKIYSTDDKYRLPACVDERTTVYSVPGNYTIYHFALENENYYGNYGIYANGLLVESCSKRYLKELAVMDLIE